MRCTDAILLLGAIAALCSAPAHGQGTRTTLLAAPHDERHVRNGHAAARRQSKGGKESKKSSRAPPEDERPPPTPGRVGGPYRPPPPATEAGGGSDFATPRSREEGSAKITPRARGQEARTTPAAPHDKRHVRHQDAARTHVGLVDQRQQTKGGKGSKKTSRASKKSSRVPEYERPTPLGRGGGSLRPPVTVGDDSASPPSPDEGLADEPPPATMGPNDSATPPRDDGGASRSTEMTALSHDGGSSHPQPAKTAQIDSATPLSQDGGSLRTPKVPDDSTTTLSHVGGSSRPPPPTARGGSGGGGASRPPQNGSVSDDPMTLLQHGGVYGGGWDAAVPGGWPQPPGWIDGWDPASYAKASKTSKSSKSKGSKSTTEWWSGGSDDGWERAPSWGRPPPNWGKPSPWGRPPPWAKPPRKTQSPTQRPVDPTAPPTASPTTAAPTTTRPTYAPTTAYPTTYAPTESTPRPTYHPSPAPSYPPTFEPTAPPSASPSASPTTGPPSEGPMSSPAVPLPIPPTDSPTSSTYAPTSWYPTYDPTPRPSRWKRPPTWAPATEGPTTYRPTTYEPTTYGPTTGEPTSAAPTSSAPTSAAPTTATPTSAAPTSSAPTSAAPTSAAPTTSAPTSSAPTTAAPTTAEPTTAEPTTSKPVTSGPTTAEPTTYVPTTYHPTTSMPTDLPTGVPTSTPTSNPTSGPTSGPTTDPTSGPTRGPTRTPTTEGPTTREPTEGPTTDPTSDPSIRPSMAPSKEWWEWPRLHDVLLPNGLADEPNGFLGASIAIDGHTLVVGIRGDDERAGSVAVYRYSPAEGTFVKEAVLRPSDGQPGDDFGRSVAVSGDRVLVGAQTHDWEGVPDTGAAYVFQRDGGARWTEASKLVPGEGLEENSRFGISVAIHSGVALVGANGDDSNGENAGAAYVFSLSETGSSERGWVHSQKLAPPDGEAGDSFGFSVALHRDGAVVGAVWDEDRAGSAYVYRLSDDGTWIVEGKFTADGGGRPGDQFGWSVDVHRDTVAVGAFAHDADGSVSDGGAVYVFRRDSRDVWRRQARVSPDDGDDNDHFGRSVRLHGDHMVVSAPLDDDAGVDAGAVYVYERGTDDGDGNDDWSLQAKLDPTVEDPPDGTAVMEGPMDFNEFGFGVAASKDFFVVSSKLSAAGDAVSFGSCYVYGTRRWDEPTAAPAS